MGFNSWTAIGTGVSDAFLREIGQFFISSGLAAAGYEFIDTDDGWDIARNSSGYLQPDPEKFPDGITGLAGYLHSLSPPLKFGIYAAASSVVCSGRPGSLYLEDIDARTFAAWNVDLVKYDNCGEYALGISRFYAFADAVNRTGRAMAVSTEPFSITPNPLHAEFANMWRTGNDISADYGTIVNRADLNDKWAPFAGPGHWNDPDMLQVGNGGLTLGEDRVHFGLWAIMKSPLILGTDVRKLSPEQLTIVSNPGLIAVNQDPLGVQARKLAAAGVSTPRYVGLAPCAGGSGSYNGVTAASLVWALLPPPANLAPGFAPKTNGTLVSIFNNETGRCLAQMTINKQPTVALMPCNASDPSQAWLLPTGPLRLGSILSATTGAALTAGDSTVYGTIHGSDAEPLPDASYGLTNLTFSPYSPEPPCNDRGCDDYVPEQTWYFSPSTSRISLSLMSANIYRCFEGSCYVLTGHYPASADYCLAHVLSISNDGTAADLGGSHVWGGPLANGQFVMAVENRDASNGDRVTVEWSLLEVAGVGSDTAMCVRDLYANATLGVFKGGVTVEVPPHDIVVLRLYPGASSC